MEKFDFDIDKKIPPPPTKCSHVSSCSFGCLLQLPLLSVFMTLCRNGVTCKGDCTLWVASIVIPPPAWISDSSLLCILKIHNSRSVGGQCGFYWMLHRDPGKISSRTTWENLTCPFGHPLLAICVLPFLCLVPLLYYFPSHRFWNCPGCSHSALVWRIYVPYIAMACGKQRAYMFFKHACWWQDVSIHLARPVALGLLLPHKNISKVKRAIWTWLWNQRYWQSRLVSVDFSPYVSVSAFLMRPLYPTLNLVPETLAWKIPSLHKMLIELYWEICFTKLWLKPWVYQMS